MQNMNFVTVEDFNAFRYDYCALVEAVKSLEESLSCIFDRLDRLEGKKEIRPFIGGMMVSPDPIRRRSET